MFSAASYWGPYYDNKISLTSRLNKIKSDGTNFGKDMEEWAPSNILVGSIEK